MGAINQQIWAVIEAGKDKEMDYTLEPPERKKKKTLPTLLFCHRDTRVEPLIYRTIR